ncbi:S1 family peptidase [Morganella morganii]|uniref:S1 family peptidase n=1 Tax=Morganella morganii TaxID=582 RepID=UPI00128CD30B|nr:serine protease [Morganella morganii]MQC06419.1 serine protease [Morganella morganii]MQC11471.1 serine protease [Morganella morganii]MQC14809.1 serine protease [Morganella morganii]
MNMSLGDSLELSTARIEANSGSVGTGFFLFFRMDEDAVIPVLVTNKHVIEGANEIRFQISGTGNGMDRVVILVDNVQERFIFHPDDEVDLCALPIASILEQLEEGGFKCNIFPFHEDIIFTNKNNKLGTISAIQEIHMTGYPNGLWDEVNNKPITRKGVTASNVKLRWQGKNRFMIDMACFPGSSGSPVYVYNEGVYMDGGDAKVGKQLILLGILFAGPQLSASGDIQIVEVPTDYKYMVSTNLMMNLGVVIKADELFVIKKMIIDAN